MSEVLHEHLPGLLAATRALEDAGPEYARALELLDGLARRAQRMPAPPVDRYLVEFDTQQGDGSWVSEEHVVTDAPQSHYADCATPLYRGLGMHQADLAVTELRLENDRLSRLLKAHGVAVPRASLPKNFADLDLPIKAMANFSESALAEYQYLCHRNAELERASERAG